MGRSGRLFLCFPHKDASAPQELDSDNRGEREDEIKRRASSLPAKLETNLIQGPSANNAHQREARGSDLGPKISGEGDEEAEGTVRKGYLEEEGREGEDLRDRKVSQAETRLNINCLSFHNLGCTLPGKLSASLITFLKCFPLRS